MDNQTSNKILVEREQSLSDKFQVLKWKINLKKLELDVSNKQRIIDKILQQVKVQGAESLINNKSAKWLIIGQYEKVRLTIQEGSKLEEPLTTACESLHSALEAAGAEVSDENTSKWYKFDNLSWENQKILNEILDPLETSGQNSASSSRTSMLNRSSRQNYDHIKPTH